MSGGVLVHHGVAISHTELGYEEEAILAATVRGDLPGYDGDDYAPRIKLRCRIQHAFSTDPEVVDGSRHLLKRVFDLEPDDGETQRMVYGWLYELYKARPIYFGKRGRRTTAEMAWLKFRLYLLALRERPATVRGMYYRMVSAGYIPKDDRAYNLVQRTLLDMRRQGLMPWHWTTDSSRRIWGHSRFGDMEAYADYVASNYRKDYWMESPVNVEVWCEKDAMQGVIAPVVLRDFGLDLYVSKGQSSASYLYEAAMSIKEDGRPTVVYILSDFDPAGFRIAEKIEAGLREHLPTWQDLKAVRVAVSHEQVLTVFTLMTEPMYDSRSDRSSHGRLRH